MKLGEIKTITGKIEQGAWVKDLPNLPGVAVRVRGYGNADYRRLLTKLRQGKGVDEINDPGYQEEENTRLLHETILLDWNGIEDTPYDSETAKMLLSNPEYAVFRSGVMYAANVVAQQGQASFEDDRKN